VDHRPHLCSPTQSQDTKFGSGDEKCHQLKWLNWSSFRNIQKCCYPYEIWHSAVFV